MRLLLHTLVLLVIAAILGGVAVHHLDSRRSVALRGHARAELVRLQQQIHLRMALAPADSGPLTSIDPDWFEEHEGRPTNPLLGLDHPWVEIAAASQRNLLHPPNLAAGSREMAGFWYNPAIGVVRARVPSGISDAQTLSLYNEINDCSLTALFPQE